MRKRYSEHAILLPYQKKCLDIIKKASVSNNRVLLSIARGFGKTSLIHFALDDLLKKKKIQRALIVSPRKSSEFKPIDKLKSLPVVSFSLAEFRETIEQFPSSFFNVVFLDDCQNLTNNDWDIAEGVESAIVGLTSSHPLLISSERMLSFFDVSKPTYSYGLSSVRLRELAKIFPGVNYHQIDLIDRGTWKFIRPRDIKGNLLQKVVTFTSKEFVDRNQKRILRGGDILLQNVFNFDRMAIITDSDLPAIASKNLFVIRSKNISPAFLFDHLQSTTVGVAFRKQLEAVAYGTTIKHIRLKDVKDIPVPLPVSDEHLTRFTNIKRFGNFDDLVRTGNEIAHLKRAYQKYSKDGE